MARRTNYIEYFLPQVTASVATVVVRAFDPIWVAVPETGSRTFESVWVQFTARDDAAAAATVTNFRMPLSLSNGSGSHTAGPLYTCLVTITNTGEHQSWAYSADYTSFFNTSFTGPGMALFVSGVFTGIATSNWTAKLCMAYSYDDTVQTQRIKTVKIPIDSINQLYRPQLWEVGGTGSWAVPALDTFLPEGSKIYRDIAFEFFGNECAASTTNCSFSTSLDAETPQADKPHTQNLNSAVWYNRVWKRLGTMTTSAPHRLFVGAGPASRFNCMGGILNVTYEYNTQTTTEAMNSLWMPFQNYGGSIGVYGNYSAGVPRSVDFSTQAIKFWVEEPTPVLVTSGIVFHWVDSSLITRPAISVNNARTRSFNGNGASVGGALTCGGNSIVHRFDSGSYSGSMSLARGENTINVMLEAYDFGTAFIGTGTNFSAMAIVNYRSLVASGGIGTHNHTVIYNWLQMVQTVPSYVRDFSGFKINEPRYWINNVGFEYIGYYSIATSSVGLDIYPSVPDECSGWRTVGVQQIGNSTEIGLTPSYGDATRFFKQHPQERYVFPGKMWATSSKRFGIDTSDSATPWNYFGWGNAMVTYHSITPMISGTVMNYRTGDGSGIGVEVYRKRDNYLCLSMSTAVGGTFGEVWYDDVEEYYCVAIPNSTSVGRSKAAVPS